MAFIQGQIITASELNNVNYDKYIQYSGGSSYYPSSSGIFLRNKTRQVVYSAYEWQGNTVTIRLQKLIGSTWTSVYSYTLPGNQSKTDTITGQGEGWYRMILVGVASFTYLRFYYAHYPNVQYSVLRYYDAPVGDGYATNYPIITADMLNSGRVGTID